MRVLFCLNGPGEINGPNVWLLRHLPLLRSGGLEPEILYLSADIGLPCRNRAAFEAQGFKIRLAQLQPTTEASVEAICAALDGDLPDVFVPNYSVPAYFAARFLRDTGCATVGVIHSDDPYYFDLVDLFVCGLPYWRMSGLVVVSSFLFRMIRRETELPLLCAPCGAPLFESVAKRGPEPLRLVYLGRLVERQKRILRVAKHMCAATASVSGVEAIIYGDGTEREMVEKILLRGLKGERVRLCGPLPPEKVAAKLANSHVFVLLSDFEGFSIALVEAMSAGLVPIVSPLRSGLDLVRNGENGFIIDPDDEEAFVAIVRLLVNEPERWSLMSRAARSAVRDGGFTSDACADRWISFLRGLRPNAQWIRPDLMLPPSESWYLPARSTRVGGIRRVDERFWAGLVQVALKQRRPLLLWGASGAGRKLARDRPDIFREVSGFIDTDMTKHGTKFLERPVCSPDVLASNAKKRPFVVITSLHRLEISAALDQIGYVESSDYVAAPD